MRVAQVDREDRVLMQAFAHFAQASVVILLLSDALIRPCSESMYCDRVELSDAEYEEKMAAFKAMQQQVSAK